MRKTIVFMGLICALGGSSALAEEAVKEEVAPPTWKGALGLAWVATSGNTDTSTFGLDFGLERKPEPWGLSFVVRGNRAEDKGSKTAENYLVSGRAVRSLSERWEVFGGLAWARDPFAGFDSQTLATTGATYHAVKTERHLLSFDMGLSYTWENRVSPAENVDFVGGLLGLGWEWKLGESSKLIERLVLIPNFDDSDDWRVASETAVQADVNEWLALRFGFEIRHRNQPIDDAESTDTTSKASVVLNF